MNFHIFFDKFPEILSPDTEMIDMGMTYPSMFPQYSNCEAILTVKILSFYIFCPLVIRHLTTAEWEDCPNGAGP